MSNISVLGIFVADISFSGHKIPAVGETILGNKYNVGPGGKGCNQAVAIARLGARVNFISKIGKDSYGELALNTLTKNKINTEISNAWSKYQSFKSVLEATKAQLKAAEIANEGITLEYDSGNNRTTLELIQSRSLLLESRIAFAKSERDFIVSQFELAKQLGSLSIQSIK